ncbi:MAG: beta-propeller domain-containing protein [Acidimicrobiia bacterium]
MGFGFPVPFLAGRAVDDVAVLEAAPATTTAASFSGSDGAAPVPGVDFSGTNVQEIGVDEPDIVKSDGRRIIALSQNTLFVVDVTGVVPELLGELHLGDRYVQDMFLSGDTVLLMGANWQAHLAAPAIESDIAFAPNSYGTPTADLVEIDISDPTDIDVVRVLEMDGSYLSARMVGDTVRIVVNSGPTGLVWAFPEGGGLRAERTALEQNKEIIRNSTIDNWVPYFVMTDGTGKTLAEGSLVQCERANHPVEFSGLGMLNVVTVDLGNGLDIVDAMGVLASGETVYASTDSLYVATQRWVDWSVIEDDAAIEKEIDTVRTAIHQFDISSNERTDYVASGEVTGFLLNQFAMSEHQGNLRVASTTTPNWWWGDGRESESLVTVVAPRDGVLETIGSVDGLGRGEQIFSVRFLGDVGYVVTFRQTDPLYTIDLSDPADPRVAGEVKILGYSAYLHPVDDGLLLGIGQDATEQGRTLGTQVSLFDVSDLASPHRIDQLTLGEGNSSVEYDHRAFLHWPQTGLAVLPVQSWSYDERTGKEEVFFGAFGIDVDLDGELTPMGKISHPGGSSDGDYWDWMAQIQRSVVVHDALYTVSFKGILKSDLGSLDDEIWVPFDS